jgi:methyltransferase family protein
LWLRGHRDDNVRGYGPGGMVNQHWTVLDVNIADPDAKLLEKYEAITCIGVLEHIEDHVRTVQNMVALLEIGGFLILTTPFSYFNPHPNVYTRSEALYGKGLPSICIFVVYLQRMSWINGWLAV